MLAIKYSFFAVISIGVNLSVQYYLNFIYTDKYQFYVSLLLGTLAGLIVKYVLDKKYIFYYAAANLKADFSKFIVYFLMGVVTTLVFWGTEMFFHFFIDFQNAKYLGGLLGLSVGYFIKYNLDKKFVFVKN